MIRMIRKGMPNREDAMAALFRQHYNELLRCARIMLHDDEDARDEIRRLALHEEVGVVVQADAVRLAGARQNDKAQRHESRDHQAQRVKCGLAHVDQRSVPAGSLMI